MTHEDQRRNRRLRISQASIAIERALSELPSWRPPMRVTREGLLWTARIDTYPFGAARGLTRDAAVGRAVARARCLRGGGLRALLDAHRQNTLVTAL